MDYVKKKMNEDISTKLEAEVYLSLLERSFDLPYILGYEFDSREHMTLTLDGDEGIVIVSENKSPLGLTSMDSRRDYPEVLKGLEELQIQIDSNYTLFTEGIVSAPKPRLDHSKSNILLIFILVSSIIWIFSIDEFANVILMMDSMILLWITSSRKINPKKKDPKCLIPFFLIIGVLMMILSLTIPVNPPANVNIPIFIMGFYTLLAGILCGLNGWEKGTL
jgi:hypothetical protein